MVIIYKSCCIELEATQMGHKDKLYFSNTNNSTVSHQHFTPNENQEILHKTTYKLDFYEELIPEKCPPIPASFKPSILFIQISLMFINFSFKHVFIIQFLANKATSQVSRHLKVSLRHFLRCSSTYTILQLLSFGIVQLT